MPRLLLTVALLCLFTACSDAEPCGNGVLDPEEACDDGAGNADDAACTTTCTVASCGDGLVYAGVEDCDLGEDNADDGECLTSCDSARCGDGFVQAAVESCDDGELNSDTTPDACRLDCALPGCGDGTPDTGEDCDDAGESTACDDDCSLAECGDGTFNPLAGEDCDELIETANCDADCSAVSCGDGTLNTSAGEICDDGNGLDDDACPDGLSQLCLDATCGDGATYAGVEECDDGNFDNDDSCRNSCFDGSPTDPCDEDIDCADNLCDASGACRQPCDDHQLCPPGEGCTIAERLSGGPVAACLSSNPLGGLHGERCADDSDCQTALCTAGRCAELCTACDGAAICEASVVNRFDADLDVGTCAWRVARPDIELGPIVTDTNGSAELTFDVPAGTGSFTLAVLDEQAVGDYAQRPGIHYLEAPDGTVLIDAADGVPDLNPYGVPYPGAASALVPSTDDPSAAVQEGTYRMRVAIYETVDFITYTPVDGDVEQVLIQFESDGEEGGVVDLNVHFSPATTITAANAATDNYVATVLGEIDFQYATWANVRIGEVEYFEIPDTHDVVSSFDQIREICDLYSRPGPHGGAVNVFIVDQLTMTSGVAGGIPGPPGVFGTPASGIVAYDILNNPIGLGVTLAHEMGHFLGLHHTSQINFNTDTVVGADPISDTAICDETVLPDFNQCADQSNLMFPVFDIVGISLSNAQSGVLRGNPLLYELDRGDCGRPTYDISAARFGTGDSGALRDDDEGSCGGASAPERAHAYRLRTPGLAQLEISVIGEDFAPTVYVRTDACGDPGAEIACADGDAGTDVTLSIDAPATGTYYVFVDGRDAQGGEFVVTVDEIVP